MYQYSCEVNPQDTLVAYETDNEVVGKVLFALVAENRRDSRKVSVLLAPADAKHLCEKLHAFVTGQAE